MDITPFTAEIMKQPDALRDVADYYGSDLGAKALASAAEKIGGRRRIMFTGMGTSLYAPSVIRKELADLSPSVDMQEAGELLHFGLKSITSDDVVIAISQSGESAETRQVVETLSGRVTIIAIMNDLASSIGRKSDIILPLSAGEEISISTKTYSNTLAVLYLLSTCLNGMSRSACVQDLRTVADMMEMNIEGIARHAKRAVAYLGNIGALHVIARGSDLVTARQWALISKEGTGMFSESLSAGLFRHGPIEMAGAGHAAAFVVSEGNEAKLTVNLAEEMQGKGSRVLIVSDRDIGDRSAGLNISIESPAPRYFPIMCAPFIEFFVHEMAKRRGREAGVFRHAVKITSRE